MSDMRDKLADAANYWKDQWVLAIRERDADRAEIKRLRDENHRLRDERDNAAHVLVEESVVPGSCRCDSCRNVAKSMEDAGFLEGEKDKWWKGGDDD